jgi:serine protease Do
MSPRKLAAVLSAAAFATALLCAQDAPRRRENPASAAIRKASPSLWTIESAKDGKSEQAVGAAVDSKGIVLVPSESIGPAHTLVAIAEDGARTPAKLLYADPKLGIAVIRIMSEKQIPRLEFADRTKIEVGDATIGIGQYPSRTDRIASTGIVSAVRELADKETYILTDMSLCPGSPPSVVLDIDGRVMGLSPRAGNIGFVVPCDRLQRLLEKPPK